MKKFILLTLVVSLLLTSFCLTIDANAASNEKFLIIVSNPLLKASNGTQLQQALDQYKADLINEGWLPAQVNVNNVADGSAQKICSTPDQLKEMIRGYYGNGYTGFIMIGSHPAIQTAWFRNKNNTIIDPNDGYYADPCDIYYADMNMGWTVNSGFVSPPLDSSGNYNFSNIAPEMFFGRIYIKGSIVRQSDNSYDTIDNDYKECREVIKYLNKVHSYRIGTGATLTNEEESRYYLYGECSKDHLNSYLDSQFTSVKLNYDPTRSNDEYLYDTLSSQGFKAVFINGHGFINAHNYVDSTLINGTFYNPNPNFLTSDKLRKINVKSRAVLLVPCSSSRYISYKLSTNGNNEDCLGKAYIYNSDYVLNVFGDLAPSNLYYPGSYTNIFNDATNICAGKAAQNFLITNYCYYTMQATFYGDPTIKYKKTKTTSTSMPVVTNYFRNVEVKAGNTVSLPIRIKDSDSSSVNMQIDGLPNTSTITASVPITNSTGTYNLNWTVPTDAATKYFNVTIKLNDSQGNKYEETFKLYVSAIENGMLLNKASGWTISGSGYQLNDSTITPITIPKTTSDPKPCEISLTSGYATLSQELNLEPNRDYKLLYYGVNGLSAPNNASVSIANISNSIPASEFVNFLYKDISFNSGNTGKVSLKISLGSQASPVSGKATLSGFRLVPFYWNMFNMPEFADTNTWQFEESSKWAYEKGELSSEAGEGIKALLKNQAYKNVTVESDVTVSNSTTYSGAGIVLRATNIGSGPDAFKGYTVSIDAFNKAVTLARFNNNCTIAANHLTNILPNKKYHLKVDMIENVIKVYLDDMINPVIVYKDTNPDRDQLLAAGQVGVRNYRTHAHYDNFEVNGVSVPLFGDDFDTDTTGIIPTRLRTVAGESSTNWTVSNKKLKAVAGEGIKAVIKKVNSSEFDSFGNFILSTKINVANETTYSSAGIMFRASNINAGADMFTGYNVTVDAFNNAIILWKLKTTADG